MHIFKRHIEWSAEGMVIQIVLISQKSLVGEIWKMFFTLLNAGKYEAKQLSYIVFKDKYLLLLTFPHEMQFSKWRNIVQKQIQLVGKLFSVGVCSFILKQPNTLKNKLLLCAHFTWNVKLLQMHLHSIFIINRSLAMHVRQRHGVYIHVRQSCTRAVYAYTLYRRPTR